MPPLLSKSKDRNTWERAWQQKLDTTFKNGLIKYGVAFMPQFESIAKQSMTDHAISSATINHKTLCKLQVDLTAMAREKCGTENFEEKWRALDPKVREDHYFEAIKSLSVVPDMEEQRAYAPEVSLRELQARNGQGYLDVMYLLTRQTSPHSYVMIENPIADKNDGVMHPFDTTNNVPKDPKIFMTRNFVVRRTLYITLIIWNMLLSFYGLSDKLVSVKGQTEYDAHETLKNFASHMGKGKQYVKNVRNEVKAERKQAQWLCNYCNKVEEQLAEPLKACAKCTKIQRMVRYCSKECQVADWKSGTPPHKTICGKPFTPDTSLAARKTTKGEESDNEDFFDPPDAGYVRSPALLHQIEMLKEHGVDMDYVFMRPAPEPDFGVIFKNVMGKMMFRILRRRAMNNGDPGAVYRMFKMLSDFATRDANIGIDGLKKQLFLEYGVQI